MYSVYLKYQMTNICIKLHVCPYHSITNKIWISISQKSNFLIETCLRSLPVQTRISYWFNSKFQFICILMNRIIFSTIFITISYFYIISYILSLLFIVCMKVTLKLSIFEAQLKTDENIIGICSDFMIWKKILAICRYEIIVKIFWQRGLDNPIRANFNVWKVFNCFYQNMHHSKITSG